MEKERIPDINQENHTKKSNPNSIGELLSIGNDLPTSPDKVYRSVGTKEAIVDIETSGIVRNKQSAGLVEKSRWGERVFWSKGAEGKYHSISRNGFVIEVPLSIAEERIVTKEDITAIYTKDENGKVVDILQQKKAAEEIGKETILEQGKVDSAQRLVDIKKSLGING